MASLSTGNADTRKIECSTDILGRGGFSIVFKGRWDNKDVAVKRIVMEDVDEREVQFLTTFKHANILKLLQADRDAGFAQVFVFPMRTLK